MPLSSILRPVAALLLALSAGGLQAQGLSSQTWPAGTQLSSWNHGGRITTFHRGYLYLGGTDDQDTWIYDISDPTSPQMRRTVGASGNGHIWNKLGDVWWRQYAVPELGDVAFPFQNLSNPLAPTQQTAAIGTFPVEAPMGWPGNWLDTYPYWFGEYITDARIGWWPPVNQDFDVRATAALPGSNQWRLGNLLFFTPSDNSNGIAVFDIGNPAQPVLLDRITGNWRQYTTNWQVWRHYLVLMIGDDTNGPDGNANTLLIDFSDPTNLTLVHTIRYDDLPGRYASFQDEYAFAGRFNRGTKYNLETREVEQVFTPTPCCVGDFQWIPLGHLLLASSSEVDGSRSLLFAHQSGLDTRRPTVGYHLPRPGATHQPPLTAIGLVINETLDSPTVSAANIQLRPIGPGNVPGAPLSTVVLHSSYQVVSVVPDDALAPDTTYELRLVRDGVRDVAGNGVAEYAFRFSTGAEVIATDDLFGNGFEP